MSRTDKVQGNQKAKAQLKQLDDEAQKRYDAFKERMAEASSEDAGVLESEQPEPALPEHPTGRGSSEKIGGRIVIDKDLAGKLDEKVEWEKQDGTGEMAEQEFTYREMLRNQLRYNATKTAAEMAFEHRPVYNVDLTSINITFLQQPDGTCFAQWEGKAYRR
jgi:hypothetical protein